MVGTFIVCFSNAGAVADTKQRVDADFTATARRAIFGRILDAMIFNYKLRC